MTNHAHALIVEATIKLAGRPHSPIELHDELCALVIACSQPERREVVPVRRMPAAGEVLPPQQRATWARGKTEYDA